MSSEESAPLKSRLFPSPRLTAPVSTPLSILDATVARFPPTGAIWLFDSDTVKKGSTLSDTIDVLKSSFVTTLNSFPHWAGQLQWCPVRAGGSHTERFGRPMVVYGHDFDPGVEWVISRQSGTLDSIVPTAVERAAGNATWIASDFPQEIFLSDTQLALYNLRDFEDLPGMSVQITTFACGSYAVAVKLAHILADAQALVVFVHQWAAASRAQHGASGKSLMDSPVFNPSELDTRAAGDIDADSADPPISETARSLPCHRFDWWNDAKDPAFPSFLNPTSENSKPPAALLPATTLSPSIPAPWNTWDLMRPVSHAQLHFTEQQLSTLRSCTRESASSRPDISRLDALLAHIWSAINRARGHAHSSVDVYLNVTLGARTRVDPPLPDSFIGSPIFLTHVRMPGAAASATSLGPAASAIRGTIALFTPEKMDALLHDAAHEVSPQRLWQAFLGSQHTIVTSWLRLRVYDVDFVGGRKAPRYVQAVMPKMDGCVQVMESCGEVGGVDVSLYLESEAMGKLVKEREEFLAGLKV